MPSKQKSVDICVCGICGYSLSVKDSLTHKTVCTEEHEFAFAKGLGDEFNFSRLLHPVIFRNLFVGKYHSLKAKEIQDQTRLPSTSGIVLLNPVLMRHCEFSFTKPVVINRSAVLQAWPSSSVPVNSVGLLSQSVKLIDPLPQTDYVMVEDLVEDSVDAETITFTVSNPNSDTHRTENFVNFVLKSLVGRYLASGGRIVVDYYGQEHQLTVERITGVDGSDSTSPGAEILENSLATKLSAQCSIAEIPPVQTSTPTKDMQKNRLHTNNRISSDGISIPRKTFCLVTHSTKIKLSSESRTTSNGPSSADRDGPTLEDFGGYDKQVEAIKDMITNCLFQPNRIKSAGLHTPQGLLLYGPSGSGKTMCAKAVAAHFPVSLITVTGADVWSKYFGETDARLAKLFQQAKESAPCILLLDDLSSLCPRRDSSRVEVQRRAVATVLRLLDELSALCREVFVLATTSAVNDVDVAVRRPGRLDTELELGVPSVNDRYQILKKILRKIQHVVSDKTIQDIAENAHGYLGSDLAALCKEATLHAVQRGCSPALDSVQKEISITTDDLIHGLQVVKPSAMKEVTLEISKVSWSDIGGQEDLKHKLRQAVEWPLKHPEAFHRLGIRPPRGLLMYGPPGCSKTMIARALAKESGLNFIAIKGPELFSKWVGESERAVRQVFSRARAAAPAIVFFDEIDALASARGSGGGGGGDVSDRVLAQLLTEMDGVETLKDILVVAATNRPDLIDKALMRPGRLDRIVYVPLPDHETRRAIFSIKFRTTPVAEDVDIEQLVQETENYSGAEVTAVCHEAAVAAMQEDIAIPCVHRRHFIQALSVVTPRITPQLLDIYCKYQSENASAR